jgi:ADP-ribosylglycohydrolase
MLGAVIGDIAGSIYEGNNHLTTVFPFFQPSCHFTDDSVLTLAIARWLTEDSARTDSYLKQCMHEMGNRYSDAGFSRSFRHNWLYLPIDQAKPYGSFGNGSAMRVSPVGLVADNMEQCLEFAKISAALSHNTPEGIKGAQAIAACVYIARTSDNVFSHQTKRTIRTFVEERIGYDLNFTLDDIRSTYATNPDAVQGEEFQRLRQYLGSCAGTCPYAIRAYLEGQDFEEVIRLSISIGGDSDTIAAMAGGIAGAQFDIPEAISKEAYGFLDDNLRRISDNFEHYLGIVG